MCTKVKFHFWKCGHRVQQGIVVCSPWAERSQILGSNGKCPNDCVSVERCDARCWDCTFGDMEEPTFEGFLEKLRQNLERDLAVGMGGQRS